MPKHINMTRKDNSCLLETAPELLECCKEVLPLISPTLHICKRLKKAIALAEGVDQSKPVTTLWRILMRQPYGFSKEEAIRNIEKGNVKVNGTTETDFNTQLYPADIFECWGNEHMVINQKKIIMV
jgi:hypothetical protein